MKQSSVYFHMTFWLCLAVSAAGWPVTNSPTGSNWDLSSTTMDFRTVVARTLMLNHFDAQGRDSCDLVMAYAKSQGIPISNVVNEAITIAEEGFAMLESGSITNEDVKASLLRYCRKALVLVCRPRDRVALPYLESKTVSQDKHIRLTAANGIINILGPDSIGFIRVAATNGLYGGTDIYGMYKTFGGRLKVERKKTPEVNQVKSFDFLMGLAEKEESGSTVEMLDQILCETLDGYSTSVQRRQMAERLVKQGPDYCRHYFEEIGAMIEKTPKEKRKDFRAKGELFDPERNSDEKIQSNDHVQ